jgi:glycosyltransferase involved in cell wall biosynthesis
LIDPELFNPELLTDSPTSTFWIQATPGTSYWRCLVPAKALGGQCLKLKDRDLKEVKKVNPFGEVVGEKIVFPRQAGPSVWQFPGNPTRGRIMAGMQAEGIKVLVESDDNYTIPHTGVPGVSGDWKARQKGDTEHTSRQVHIDICRGADGIIVSTPWLEQYYSRYNRVFVCPNSVDPDDWDEPQKIDDGKLRIGYHYSSSHWYDIDLVFDALEWAAKQTDVEIIFMGPVFPEKVGFRKFKFVHVGWQPALEDYRRNLQLVDVGLCPIKPGEWPNSRSDIKALELVMAGAMPVMSPTESYKPWFHLNGDACLFPEENTPRGWLEVVKEIVDNRDMVRETAKAAHEYVLAERTIAKNVHLWRKAFEG